MSKAFTKEGDEPEVALELRPLPPGTINYITRSGYERLRAGLAGMGEARAAAMSRRLDTTVVVDPEPAGARVTFGCTDDGVANDDGRSSYMIVGVDEVDERAGRISWLSPIGRALVGQAAGDVVTVETPRGELELAIRGVR